MGPASQLHSASPAYSTPAAAALTSQSTEEAGAHHLCGIPTPHPMHNLAGSSDVLEDHLMAHTAPVSVRIKANILGLDGPRKPYG